MLEIGQDLQQGRYRIKAHLNQGGMGTVYLATDRNLSERLVAIKENGDTLGGVQAQFLHEAVLLARLTHPNLPRVTDHFVEPSGRQYLVMDYISGDDLKEILQKRQAPLPEAEALAWMGQVMDALTYMHSWVDSETGQPRPIIHRDIKPSNIKRTADGRIVLVDFGVAKYQTSFGTQIGARAVTPGYSPLEQYTGGTDVRSDVYALGATLYHLLTNTKPPDSPSIAGGKVLLAPRKLNPQVSRNTERVILRAMQVQAADRFANIPEMRAALDGRPLLNFGPDRRTSSPSSLFTIQHADRPVQRSHSWVWIGIIALIALLAFAITAATVLPPILQRLSFAPVTPNLVILTPSRPTASATLPAIALSTASQATVTSTMPTAATSTSTPVALLVITETLTPSAATATVQPEDPTETAVTRVQAASVATATIGVTATVTVAPTPTSLPTATPTATVMPTVVPTASPSVTATPTPLPTATSTATTRATATVLPTNPPTVTPSPLPTATASATPMPTNSPTATPSPRPTPTASATPVPTNPPTSTPTLPPATATPTPGTPAAGTTRVNPTDSAIYLYVPAGPFTMGSTDNTDEMPMHTVDLADFWMQQTEVTNTAYGRCITANVCTPPANQRWNDATYANYPVTNISWNQANQYATWVGGRLPTEAEWEKAARGTDARIYPWGEQEISDELLNYNFVKGDTMPVGSYPAGAGPYGTLDMAGNVEEWVADWYGDTYYASAPAQNPLGPETGIFRVVRGGSFNSKRVDVRTTVRGKALPNSRLPGVGFRVVLPGTP